MSREKGRGKPPILLGSSLTPHRSSPLRGPMIRAVIFDFNGVLVDDESVHFDLFREVLAEEGVELTEDQYHERYLGYDDRQCLETALVDRGRSPTPDQIDDLIARKAERYIRRAE